MSSEEAMSEPSLLERLISSRNRELSLFLPILLGLTNPTITTNPIQYSTDPDQETQDPPNPRESRDRIILVNPLTQGMVVIEGSSSRLDSLLRDLLSKDGQPPASRSSIEAMESVEIGEEEEEGGDCCGICLEEWRAGGVAKEMPCKHRFHGGCIEKWLGIHGSCPVCRYKMPEDGEDGVKKSGGGDGDERERRRGRREIWVSFSVSRERSGESDEIHISESNDSSSADNQIED